MLTEAKKLRRHAVASVASCVATALDMCIKYFNCMPRNFRIAVENIKEPEIISNTVSGARLGDDILTRSEKNKWFTEYSATKGERSLYQNSCKFAYRYIGIHICILACISICMYAGTRININLYPYRYL